MSLATLDKAPRPWLYVRLYYRFAAMLSTRDDQDNSLMNNMVVVLLFPVTIVATIIVVVGAFKSSLHPACF